MPSGYNGPVTGSIASGSLQQIAASPAAVAGDVHSTTCPGLALERTERRKRIVELEARSKAELAALPVTLEQALQRTSERPEQGTNAYRELQSEQVLLDQIAAAAAKLGCPAEGVGRPL